MTADADIAITATRMLGAVRCRRHGGAILLVLAVAACGGGHAVATHPSSPPASVPSAAASVSASRTAGLASVPPTVTAPTVTAPTVTAPTVTAPTVTAPASTARRCGSARVAGTVVLALPGGRRALLAVPAGDDGHHRLGLVIALPGYGQPSEQLAVQSRLPARAIADGVLAVLPQGAGPAMSWNFSGTTGYDDRAFLSALITTLTGTDCADPARIVIAGLSDGGDMAAFAACAMPGRFRALVTVAASTEPQRGCRPIRIVAIHGDADPLDPYRGGPDGRPGYPATPPAVAGIAAWGTLDGCHTVATRRIAQHVLTLTYSCGAELVTVNGGGHTWPGGAPVRSSLGLTTSEYDATATILGLV